MLEEVAGQAAYSSRNGTCSPMGVAAGRPSQNARWQSTIDGNYADFALNRGLAVVPPPRGAIDFPL